MNFEYDTVEREERERRDREATLLQSLLHTPKGQECSHWRYKLEAEECRHVPYNLQFKYPLQHESFD